MENPLLIFLQNGKPSISIRAIEKPWRTVNTGFADAHWLIHHVGTAIG